MTSPRGKPAMKKGKLTSRIFAVCYIALFCVSLVPATAYSQEYGRDTVLKAQRRLQELGYNPGPLDGIWGEKTKGALKRFQHDHGLSANAKLDLVTQQGLGILSPEKGAPKHPIPILLSVNRIREALQYTWKIEKVQIENDILTVVPYSKQINMKEYASMILQICKELHEYDAISSQMREIRILNISENQGWVLLEAGKCDQIINSPSKALDDLIFSNSADILIFRSK